MSFPVAVQSAIFYFLACTPCAKVRHRQKAKGKAKKEREEKAKFEMEQPGLYQHPSPFNTNPFWQEEITRGPALPKKSGSKNSSQRGLASSWREESSMSVLEQTTTETTRPDTINNGTTVISEDDALSDDWNRRRGYQREDEELWGERHGGHKLMDAFSKARDSAGRLIESTLGFDKEITDQERHSFYFAPRNPPVNDYHPPVVSNKVGHKNAHRWMLQPPPPAKVMEGKIPVTRAMSSASRSSVRVAPASEEAPLSRLVQENLTRRRQRQGSEPTEEELIESLFTNPSKNIQRSRSFSVEDSDESFGSPSGARRARLRPSPASPGYNSSDDEGMSHATHLAQRPKLPTILSSDSKPISRSASRRSKRQTRSDKTRDVSGAALPVGHDSS